MNNELIELNNKDLMNGLDIKLELEQNVGETELYDEYEYEMNKMINYTTEERDEVLSKYIDKFKKELSIAEQYLISKYSSNSNLVKKLFDIDYFIHYQRQGPYSGIQSMMIVKVITKLYNKFIHYRFWELKDILEKSVMHDVIEYLQTQLCLKYSMFGYKVNCCLNKNWINGQKWQLEVNKYNKLFGKDIVLVITNNVVGDITHTKYSFPALMTMFSNKLMTDKFFKNCFNKDNITNEVECNEVECNEIKFNEVEGNEYILFGKYDKETIEMFQRQCYRFFEEYDEVFNFKQMMMPKVNYCDSCFSNNYRKEIDKYERKSMLSGWISELSQEMVDKMVMFLIQIDCNVILDKYKTKMV